MTSITAICRSYTRSSKRASSARERGGDRGFALSVALVILSLGAMALSFSVLGAAMAYAERIDKKSERIQAAMNRRACADAVSLMKAKNVFLAGHIELPEFDCKTDI